jgi:hypothetical protein
VSRTKDGGRRDPVTDDELEILIELATGRLREALEELRERRAKDRAG